MENKIDKVFDGKGIKIMTHVVCGYPNEKRTPDLVKTMEDSGADLVEIQIPFSDPLADGPTIMRANQGALDNGITVEKCFKIAEEITASVDIPILFMSYGNIPYAMGVNNFIKKSSEAGISGLIIPDMPYDEKIDFFHCSREKGIYFIPVVSPGISDKRLKDIGTLAEGFIYATLKVGITGASRVIDPEGMKLIKRIHRISSLPVGAGFGISTPGQVHEVENFADCVVIGSHLINLFDVYGLKGVGEFIRECKGNGRH